MRSDNRGLSFEIDLDYVMHWLVCPPLYVLFQLTKREAQSERAMVCNKTEVRELISRAADSSYHESRTNVWNIFFNPGTCPTPFYSVISNWIQKRQVIPEWIFAFSVAPRTILCRLHYHWRLMVNFFGRFWRLKDRWQVLTAERYITADG